MKKQKQSMRQLLLPASLTVIGALSLASCQDEDFGVSVQEVKNAKYAQTFEEMFGEIDPNQDWSMAKQVTASISGVDGDVLEIYYQNPISSDAVILARKSIVGGEATVSFDMAKNVNRVYAQVKKGNNHYYSMSGYFNVIDNHVDFSNFTRAQVMEGESRMTKGTAYTRNCYVLDPEKVGDLELYTGDALLAVDFIDGYYRTSDGINVWNKYDWYKLADFTNFIPLTNVLLTTDERPEIRVSDITSLFVEIDGEKPLFTEKQNHVKYMKPGSTPQLRKDLVFTMAEDGPMYLDYFFKGTEFDNTFGYFYYTGAAPTPEQFMTMPKYVLCDNMSTSQGGTVEYGDKNERQPWNLLQMRSGNAQSLGGIDGLDMTNENTYDNIIYGTRFQLTYFGANNELTTGTYEFPAGTKIGLFILGYEDSERSPLGKGTGNATIFTSLSDLNLKMSNEVPHAASFSYNGKIVYGMEDMLKGSDFDLNDMMFFVNGNFVEQEEEITPPSTPQTEIWIAACEDLGGTYDYDFNDLVFGVQKTLPNEETGKSDLYIIPLAAGGTMKDEIFFNGNSVGEIHDMLGSQNFTSPMNVADGSTPSEGEKIKIATGIDGSLSINQLMSLIHIQATKKDAESSTSSADGSYNIGYNYDKKNNVPQVLLLPQGWGWPSEETCIDLVYPEFKDWAGDVTQTQWIDNTDETFLAEKPGKLIPNPIQPAVPGEGGEGEEGGEGGGSSTPANPTERWNITLTGSETIKLNGVETYTATVEGIDDFTDHDVVVTCGTYNSDVAAIVENSLTITGGQIQFQVKGKVFYDVTIYVKVTGDATHRDTRKEMRISVIEDVPEFYFKTTIDNKDVRISEDSYTLDVVPTNINVNLGVEIVKGDGNAIVWSSSDESIVNIVSNSPKRVACGTVTLTATHKAVEGKFAELAKSIELTIAKLDPAFTLTGVSEDGSITVEEEKNVQLAANYVDGDRNVPYTFDIEDPTVASVTVSGNTATITGLKTGSTTITVAQAESGFYNATNKEVTVNVTASTKPEAVFTVSPSTIGLEVGTQGQINKVNMIDGDLGSLSCSIDKPEIVELVGTFNAWNPITIKAKAKGTATITITHAATTQYKAHSETITVKVGEAVEGQPVDITKCMGSLQHVSQGWINENAALVDMSEFNWADMASAKLRITGSANGQVSVSVIEGNDFVINRNLFSNGVIEGSISKLVGAKSFYIVDHQGGLTVTKLEIIPITIE